MPAATTPSTKAAPLGRILRRQRRLRLPIDPIIAAMRSGEIRPVCHSKRGTGLSSLYYDNVTINKTLDRLDQEFNVPTLGYRQTDIAVRMGIPQNVVSRLHANGHLPYTVLPGSLIQRTTQPEIDGFEARWITTTEFGKLHSLARRVARAVLLAANIPNIAMPDLHTPYFQYRFFDRQQATAESMDAVKAAILDQRAKRRTENRRYHDRLKTKRRALQIRARQR